jgi:hypothetical protein
VGQKQPECKLLSKRVSCCIGAWQWWLTVDCCGVRGSEWAPAQTGDGASSLFSHVTKAVQPAKAKCCCWPWEWVGEGAHQAKPFHWFCTGLGYPRPGSQAAIGRSSVCMPRRGGGSCKPLRQKGTGEGWKEQLLAIFGSPYFRGRHTWGISYLLILGIEH